MAASGVPWLRAALDVARREGRLVVVHLWVDVARDEAVRVFGALAETTRALCLRPSGKPAPLPWPDGSATVLVWLRMTALRIGAPPPKLPPVQIESRWAQRMLVRWDRSLEFPRLRTAAWLDELSLAAKRYPALLEQLVLRRIALDGPVEHDYAEPKEVRAWVDLCFVLDDADTAIVRARLENEAAPSFSHSPLLASVHGALASRGRWVELARLYTREALITRARTLARIADASARAFAYFALQHGAPVSRSKLARFDQALQLHGALRAVDRHDDAVAFVDALAVKDLPPDTWIGLVESGLAHGPARPEYLDWLDRAEREADPEGVERVSELRRRLRYGRADE
jgi:hypothetical protein